MSGNTSASGGYLSTVNDITLTSDQINALFHDLIVGTLGLDTNLVRPRWQPEPPAPPTAETNWCALGIASTSGLNPFFSYNDNGNGSGSVIRQRGITLMISLYGPACGDNAEILRDCFSINQNMELLVSNGIILNEIGDVTAVPEILNVKYVNRCDVVLKFSMQTTRTFSLENILLQPAIALADANTPVPLPAPPSNPPGSSLDFSSSDNSAFAILV